MRQELDDSSLVIESNGKEYRRNREHVKPRNLSPHMELNMSKQVSINSTIRAHSRIIIAAVGRDSNANHTYSNQNESQHGKQIKGFLYNRDSINQLSSPMNTGCQDHMTFSQMPTYLLIVIITYTRGLPPPGPPADSWDSKFWKFALNQRDLH